MSLPPFVGALRRNARIGSVTLGQRTTKLSITGVLAGQWPDGPVVKINGIGFNASSVVRFNGATAPTTLVSPTQVTAPVPAGAHDGEDQRHNASAPTGTVKCATNFTKT